MATRKTTTTRSRSATARPVADVFEARRKSKVGKPARVSDRVVMQWAVAQLGSALGRLRPRNARLPDTEPVLELTPRAPHGANGHMDLLWPGRWDCESNLIFMRPIVYGESPGSWDGTVAYVQLKAPASGSFLVAAVFAGFSSSQGGEGLVLRLNGPWGTTTASGQSTEPGGPIAIWNAQAGDRLHCTVSCTGGIIGYLQSIRLYPLA